MEFSSLAKTLSLNLTLKLDHNNFVFWKMQVLTAIEALDLEVFINGEKVPPPKLITVRSGDIDVQKDDPDFIAWKKTDKLLMSWILSTLSSSVLSQVTNSKSSFEIWSKIERTYSQKSLARIMQLKQQMQSIKKGSDSISDFVMKLKAVSDSLASAGEVVSDRDFIMCLLHGVGHEYDSVVTLISSQQTTMSVEDAQYLFLMHEQRIEELNSSAHLSQMNPSAQYVTNQGVFNNRGNNNRNFNNNYRGGNRGRNRGGRSGGRSNQRLHCQLCSKPGHGAWQCYKRFDQQFQGGPNQAQNSLFTNQNQGTQAFFAQNQNLNQCYNQNNSPNFSQNCNNFDQGSSSCFTNFPNITHDSLQMVPTGHYQNTSAYFASPETVADQAWYVDSGATNHVTSSLNNLSMKADYRGSENQQGSTSRES